MSRLGSRGMSRRLLATIALFAVLPLAGCGESEAEKAAESGKSKFTAVCEGTEITGAAGLPSGFPKPDAVTYLETSKAGPSSVVDGTYDGELDDAYSAYQQA